MTEYGYSFDYSKTMMMKLFLSSPNVRENSTYVNCTFAEALEVIRKNTGETPTRVGIVSNEFHIFRAVLMARDLGLEPMGIPAATSWDSLRVNYTLREIPAVWKYLVLGD